MAANPSQKGFALIELIVSIGLFLVVASIVSGAVTSLFKINTVSKQSELLSTNLEMILEDISRNARVGYDFNGSGSTFSFTTPPAGDREEEEVLYTLSGTSLRKETETTNIYPPYMAMSTNQQISAAAVNIDSFLVSVSGSSSGDKEQPMATIVITGSTAVAGGQRKTITYRTTVTQRKLDIDSQ